MRSHISVVMSHKVPRGAQTCSAKREFQCKCKRIDEWTFIGCCTVVEKKIPILEAIPMFDLKQSAQMKAYYAPSIPLSSSVLLLPTAV